MYTRGPRSCVTLGLSSGRACMCTHSAARLGRAASHTEGRRPGDGELPEPSPHPHDAPGRRPCSTLGPLRTCPESSPLGIGAGVASWARRPGRPAPPCSAPCVPRRARTPRGNRNCDGPCIPASSSWVVGPSRTPSCLCSSVPFPLSSPPSTLLPSPLSHPLSLHISFFLSLSLPLSLFLSPPPPCPSPSPRDKGDPQVPTMLK